MRNNRLGVDWLRENDPEYVAPAKKAAQTKRIAFDREAMETVLSGQVTRKVGGRYVQCSSLAFVDSGNEPAYEATQEREVLVRQVKAQTTHKAGSNSKATRNQRKRAKYRRN